MVSTRDLFNIDRSIETRYPREVQLNNGSSLTVTPLVPSDWQILEDFLSAIPHEERRFFRRALSDRQRVRRWCAYRDYRQSLPLLAWDGGRIVADGLLQRQPDLWTSHVGVLRLLVHPEYRGRGLGAAMVNEVVELARDLGLAKLVHECAADQAALITFLRRAGFRTAALLRGYIRDHDGHEHDMLVMERDLH